MKETICDKCGGSNIYVVGEQGDPNWVKPEPQKMSEVGKMNVVHAIYIVTTLRCKDCGFEHSF